MEPGITAEAFSESSPSERPDMDMARSMSSSSLRGSGTAFQVALAHISFILLSLLQIFRSALLYKIMICEKIEKAKFYSDFKLIDQDGFRLNVGIVIAAPDGRVLWARRIGQNTWQFPQGGIDAGETPRAAMYRELGEELGLSPADVSLEAETSGWHRYRLPKRCIHYDEHPVCVGQKQKWFLLKPVNAGALLHVNFASTREKPEFDGWRWVSYWYPIRQVVNFKRDVYRRVLTEFSGNVIGNNQAAAVSAAVPSGGKSC